MFDVQLELQHVGDGLKDIYFACQFYNNVEMAIVEVDNARECVASYRTLVTRIKTFGFVDVSREKGLDHAQAHNIICRSTWMGMWIWWVGCHHAIQTA
jgi:hypothetical protein